MYVFSSFAFILSGDWASSHSNAVQLSMVIDKIKNVD